MRENHILFVVSPDSALIEQVREVLHDCGGMVLSQPDYAAALANWTTPDLIILDAAGSAADLEAACAAFNGDNRSRDVPLVAVVPPDDTLIEVAFGAGAVDCFIRPLQPALIRWRVRRHLERGDDYTQHALEHERHEHLERLTDDYAYEVWVEADGTISGQWATDNLKQLTGYTPEELRGANWWRLMYDQDSDVVQDRTAALLAGETHTGEFRIVTKDGHIRWIRDSATPLVVDGRVTRIYGVGRDITQDRIIQEALQKSQERLQLALEAAEVGIWDWNMVTGEAYFSDGWAQMLGYQPDEIAPSFEAWQALIHPQDQPRIQAAITAHVEQGQPYELEHRLRAKDGRWLWVLTRGKVVRRDADGRPLRMAGTHRDVNDTRLMQEALRESEERHRIISNTISDYAYSYQVHEDQSLSKDWSTQAFYDITGYTTDEMDGDGWTRIIHPDDIRIAEKRFERLLQGTVDVTEFRIITKSGEVRWLRDHGYPVVDPGSGEVVRIYGAAQDITQRRRDEELLRRQAAELAARNEELDAFAYSVAHDLKNPIASMMGFASLVMNYYDRMDDDKIKEYLGLIMEGGYKLKSIINALLMLAGVSKMEQAELSPLDMRLIVEDAKKRLNDMIEEKQARIVTPPEWPSAQGYGPWVEEVWMNYLSNALKYGGEPPELELGADMQTNGMVRFWVRDNGEGLTDEERERVFTPFTRLNKIQVEGHGLGLSVVERIVKKLGGQVGVESTVGQGSVFSFTLPKAN